MQFHIDGLVVSEECKHVVEGAEVVLVRQWRRQQHILPIDRIFGERVLVVMDATIIFAVMGMYRTTEHHGHRQMETDKVQVTENESSLS